MSAMTWQECVRFCAFDNTTSVLIEWTAISWYSAVHRKVLIKKKLFEASEEFARNKLVCVWPCLPNLKEFTLQLHFSFFQINTFLKNKARLMFPNVTIKEFATQEEKHDAHIFNTNNSTYLAGFLLDSRKNQVTPIFTGSRHSRNYNHLKVKSVHSCHIPERQPTNHAGIFFSARI